MKEHPFGLDKSPKKHRCPECGQKTFVVYKDREGKIIDEDRFGRCDRENNCGYHLPPSAENDEELMKKLAEKPVVKEEVRQIFPTEEELRPYISRTRTCVSPFHVYCKDLGIPMEHLMKWDVLTDWKDESVTVFLFRNREGKVVNIKKFRYQANGHRDKEFKSFSLKNPPPTPFKGGEHSQPPHTPPKKTSSATRIIEKYRICGYGEHLLDPEKKRTVCLVESEKSAVIASWFYKDYDWVAVGSASGLSDGSNNTADKITPLMNRTVYWVNDNDKAGRFVRFQKDARTIINPSSCRNLDKYGIDYYLCDLFPKGDFADGYDIADAITDGLRPELKGVKPENWERVREGESKKPSAVKFDLPEGVKEEEVSKQITQYGFFTYNNRIYIAKLAKSANEMKYYSELISNFEVNPLGLILSKLNPRRLLRIKNVSGYEKVLEVPAKAFVSNTEFSIFIESEGNYQWNGSSADLKRIRASLYDNMLNFEEVESLGWHGSGYYIFANGAFNGTFHPIDDFGFVKLGDKNFFIEPLSSIHSNNGEDFEDEKKFVYVKKKEGINFKSWSSLFCRVHKENGMIALAYFITSLFRDVIYQRFKFFPHLFLFGPPGTGKSQLGWSIRSMGFNGIKKPFNLSGGTQVAFYREFSHFTNFPTWFDEYDNSIDYQRVQALKAAYDGAGHKKSVKDSDKRTKTVPVNSACIISGQQLPIADNALFKRVILEQFHQMEFSDEEKRLFSELQAMEEGGLSYITAGLVGKFRKKVETEYLKVFDQVMEDLIPMMPAHANVEDRILRNMAIIMAMVRLIEPDMNGSMPYTYEELKKVAVQNITNQMALILNSNETNTFWDMVSFLIDIREIFEEQDYKFRRKALIRNAYMNGQTVERNMGGPADLLYIRTSKIIPLYKKHFKQQQNNTASSMDKGTLIHYLQHQKYYICAVKNEKFSTGEAEGNGSAKQIPTSAYVFDLKMMEAAGIELKRGNSEFNMDRKDEESEGDPSFAQASDDKGKTGDLPF